MRSHADNKETLQAMQRMVLQETKRNPVHILALDESQNSEHNHSVRTYHQVVVVATASLPESHVTTATIMLEMPLILGTQLTCPQDLLLHHAGSLSE